MKPKRKPPLLAEICGRAGLATAAGAPGHMDPGGGHLAKEPGHRLQVLRTPGMCSELAISAAVH